MEYKVTATAVEREYRISGEFCASDEGAFFEIYLQIRRQPEPQVVFDLSQCTRVDSSAAGMLIVACEEAAQRNLIRVLRNVPAEIKEFLMTSGLGNFYHFQEVEKKA